MPIIKCFCGKDILVDDDVYPLLVHYSWSCSKGEKSGKEPGVYTTIRSSRNGPLITLSMARFVVRIPDYLEPDHIDRNGHNNKKENIRIATRQQNNFNRNRYKSSRRRYKGVSLHDDGRQWRGQLRFNGRNHHLGLFPSEFLAAMAVNSFLIKHHGEFAVLNDLTKDAEFIGPTLP